MSLFEQKKPRNDGAYIVSIITSEGNFFLYNLSKEYNNWICYDYNCLMMMTIFEQFAVV